MAYQSQVEALSPQEPDVREKAPHVPVLLEEVLAVLAPERGGLFVDATVGAGGHAEALLARAPGARLLGIDRDPVALQTAGARLARFGERVRLVHGRFAEIDALCAERADGVLADLGVSSMQLDGAERGFSWRTAGPLDMRMDQSDGDTLRGLLASIDEEALADALHELGEERRARRVARAVLRALGSERGIQDTQGLARVVRAAVGAPRSGGVDAATRTFQALRMLVNREPDELDALLAKAPYVLQPGGGVLAIISFHSGEDRRVKQAFRALSTDGDDDGDAVPAATFERVTRKAVRPTTGESARNSRARSAKLRAVRRVS